MRTEVHPTSYAAPRSTGDKAGKHYPPSLHNCPVIILIVGIVKDNLILFLTTSELRQYVYSCTAYSIED